MMKTGIGVAIVLVMAQAPAARPAVDFKGRLYRAVFVAGPDTLSSGDLAIVPEPLRARLSRFLVRGVREFLVHLPDAPLAESAFAEQVLQKDPSTPLAPFLYLFIAQRQRAAAEAAELNQNAAVAQAATAKAREFLQKARGAADPIFGLVADDLERVPFVYVRKKAGAQ